jgi:hypothetical protein
VAKEVDEHTFYHTRESGGTRISSAYAGVRKIIDEQFPPRTGTSTASSSPTATTGAKTTKRRSRFWRESAARGCNLFCYGQVESPYGSGDFLGWPKPSGPPTSDDAGPFGDRRRRHLRLDQNLLRQGDDKRSRFKSNFGLTISGAPRD